MVVKHGDQIIENAQEARQAERGPTVRVGGEHVLGNSRTCDPLVCILPDMRQLETSTSLRSRRRGDARDFRLSKWTFRIGKDLRLARAMALAVTMVSSLSLGHLRAQNQHPIADSSGAPPLQGTPATDDNKPAGSKPGGTRPTTPAPEPARPGPEAEKQGARTALPPAPAEKTAPPIKDE